MSVNDNNLIWLDLEMTGLEPKTDVILEMATIVTDDKLNILAEGPVFAIKQPDDVLDNMSAWCVEQHGKSGLTARCRASESTPTQNIEQLASAGSATRSRAACRRASSSSPPHPCCAALARAAAAARPMPSLMTRMVPKAPV